MNGRIFYNPLAALGRLNGLIGALVVVVLLFGVAFWGGVHLDGALDLHITNKAPSAGLVAAESLIAWLTLGIMFMVFSRVFGGGGSVSDHLAAAGLGRFPFIFAALISSRDLLGKAMLKAVTATGDAVTIRPQDLLTPAVIVGSLVILMLSAWMIAALLYGFKTASKMTGGKMAAAFVIAMIVAEVISKLLLIPVFKAGI